MTPKQVASQIAKDGAPKRLRAAHGQWLPPAEAVFELVSKSGWNVSDAVRKVVENFRFKAPEQAFNGVRAAYYVLKNRRDGDFEI